MPSDTHHPQCPPASIVPVIHDRYGDVIDAKFAAIALDEGLLAMRQDQILIKSDEAPPLDELGDTVATRATRSVVESIIRSGPRSIVHITHRGDVLTAHVAAGDAQEADSVWARLLSVAAHQHPHDELPLGFWYEDFGGGQLERRTVSVPPWSAIEGNYVSRVQEAVATLVAATDVPSGRLVLWRGRPGTGKTTAIRALAQAWGPWCMTHVITDPERLLATPRYLRDVLRHREPHIADPPRAWRLLVLEDAGELLTADAGERAGQSLSRLLNVTDGLIGDRAQTIVLVTTNEPLGRLHEAVRRPGRCWQDLEFLPFSSTEATRWLRDNGVSSDEEPGESTLADLFARRDGRYVPPRSKVGFAA